VVTKIELSVQAHYEVEELPYGKDYRWVPARALVECDCGRTMVVDAGNAVCSGCGSDFADRIRKISERRLPDEVLRPWRPDYEAQEGSEEHREDQEWREQRSLE
jgi:hypothetical protein